MTHTITHDVVATIGSYKDRQTGEDKKRYINVGKVFTDDQGRQSIKMDAMPVGQEWSGWLSLYPVKEREQQPPRQSAPPMPAVQRSMPPAPPLPSLLGKDEDDDIPF